MLLYLLFIPFLSPSLSIELQMQVLHEYPAAVCNDGSPAAYYTTPHDTVEKMFIFLVGGGACLFKEDCLSRCSDLPSLCTAKTEEDMELSGSFWSEEKIKNPPFSDYFKVLLLMTCLKSKSKGQKLQAQILLCVMTNSFSYSEKLRTQRYSRYTVHCKDNFA